jgi:hypothetical protein
MTAEIELLTIRVARLERENRLFQLAAAGAVLSALVLVSMGAVKSPRTIEAEKIVLLDSDGHARVTIGTPASAGAAFGIQSDDPAIWISDARGTDRAIITSEGVYFADGRAKPTVDLSSGPRPGMSSLKLYGPDGTIRWSAP